MTTLLTALGLSHALALVSSIGSVGAGLGTTFSSTAYDPTGNPDDTLACFYPRRLNPARDYVVAHRTLPCGTRLVIWNPRTGKATAAVVADRGPRHADMDLAPMVARAIGHNGREVVAWIGVR